MNSMFYFSLSRGVRKIAKSDRQLCDVCRFAWNNSAPTGWIFMKFGIDDLKKNSVEGIQVSLKSDKKYGYFTWRTVYIYDNMSPS